ncbi:hypothetical protein HG530_010685 [Fusarium avenaceum]|nr:hypothetical protein HG530_010685 [Fusarium avenaceum]
MTLNVGQNAHCGEPADLLQSLFLRPVSDRDLGRLGLDIHKASGLEALLLQIVRQSNCAAILQTAVVAAAHGVSFVALNPAAGLSHLECALVQSVPVGDAAVEEAHVYKVGRVRRERPVERKIFDLELDVRGNPARGRQSLGVLKRTRYLRRLDGRDVSANHLGLGELITKVHGPDSSSSANVQHFTRRLNRREVKLAVHDQRSSMVNYIQRLRGLVIVGGPVLSLASIGVVRSAIDGAVLEDAGVDGGCRTSGVVA